MRSYGMRSAFCTSSASAPRPLPRTTATVGRCLVSAPIAETAAFASRVIALTSWSHARFFQDLLSQEIEERPRVSGPHELRHGLRLAHLDAIPRAHEPRLKHRALLDLIAARGDVTERGVELLRGRDREEAEMADVHAEQRHAVGRERASGVEHRAVAAEYACDVEAVELRGLHVVEAHLADAVTERLDALRRGSRLVHRALEARARADRDLHSAARRAASYKTKSSGGAAPRRACTKISRLPSRPARREGTTAMTGTRAWASASATLTTAFARSAGSRTIPPRPTASRPASNWGFTSATMSPSSRRCRSDGRSTRRSEMNETRATKRSTVAARSTSPRGFSPCLTTTRGSWRSFQSSWPFPTSTA